MRTGPALLLQNCHRRRKFVCAPISPVRRPDSRSDLENPISGANSPVPAQDSQASDKRPLAEMSGGLFAAIAQAYCVDYVSDATWRKRATRVRVRTPGGLA